MEKQPWVLQSATLLAQDLQGLSSFYTSKLGFRVLDSGLGFVVLGSSEPLLILRQAAAEPRRLGLYHLAFLFSGYKDFGTFVLGLGAQKIDQSPTDHTQTVATYLSDPEGNGLEFYLDTPERGQMFTDEPGFVARRSDGILVPATQSLDLEEVFLKGQIDPKTSDFAPYSLPGDTILGHVHLHTPDFQASQDFYVQNLGFTVQRAFPEIGASFLAQGTYHHHVAVNTWNRGMKKPDQGEGPGLAEIRFCLGAGDDGAIQERVDPSGIRIVISEETRFREAYPRTLS